MEEINSSSVKLVIFEIIFQILTKTWFSKDFVQLLDYGLRSTDVLFWSRLMILRLTRFIIYFQSPDIIS